MCYKTYRTNKTATVMKADNCQDNIKRNKEEWPMLFRRPFDLFDEMFSDPFFTTPFETAGRSSLMKTDIPRKISRQNWRTVIWQSLQTIQRTKTRKIIRGNIFAENASREPAREPSMWARISDRKISKPRSKTAFFVWQFPNRHLRFWIRNSLN